MEKGLGALALFFLSVARSRRHFEPARAPFTSFILRCPLPTTKGKRRATRLRRRRQCTAAPATEKVSASATMPVRRRRSRRRPPCPGFETFAGTSDPELASALKPSWVSFSPFLFLFFAVRWKKSLFIEYLIVSITPKNRFFFANTTFFTQIRCPILDQVNLYFGFSPRILNLPILWTRHTNQDNSNDWVNAVKLQWLVEFTVFWNLDSCWLTQRAPGVNLEDYSHKAIFFFHLHGEHIFLFLYLNRASLLLNFDSFVSSDESSRGRKNELEGKKNRKNQRRRNGWVGVEENDEKAEPVEES